MKKMKLLIIPLLFLSFMACDKKSDESENIDDSNVHSSTENLELYSSLLDDIDEKGLKASLSEYYKSNFSYSISYLSGRTNYNVINYDRTCKIRNDSLYILKSTSYQYGSYESENSQTIYLKNNDSYYSYDYEYDVETLDTKEILPLYDVKKEDDFDLNDAFGFNQSILTSQSYDGTNGTIEKNDNTYTIEMSYANVKDESLVKFIINLGYFNTMLSYVTEDELMVKFNYIIKDSGYNLEYGFSYIIKNEYEEYEITAKVNLGLEKIDSFDIIDFSDESKYLKKYPQDLNDVSDVYNVGDTVTGRYQGNSLYKFYLTKGKYGLLSNSNAVLNYYIYNSIGDRVNRYNLNVNNEIKVSTNYFEVEEDGYYYVYLKISDSLNTFSINKIDYLENAKEIKSFDSKASGTFEGIFDLDFYRCNLGIGKRYILTNKSENILYIRILQNSFLGNYMSEYIVVKPNESVRLGSGSFYLMVCALDNESASGYDFEITAENSN